MTLAIATPRGQRRQLGWGLAWAAAFAVAIVIYLLADQLPWASVYPRAWIIPAADWINLAMKPLTDIFFGFTRGITAILAVPLDLATNLLSQGFRIDDGATAIEIPRLSWVGVTAAVAIAGYALGGVRLALGTGLCFLYLAVFGQWDSAMTTLALIVVAVPLGVVLGLFLGILGYRHPALDRGAIVPLLDIAQATPQFAYLVPLLIFFGNNPVSAMIATLVFAVPPMVRATTLALTQVPGEIQDFGRMAGCTRHQLLWRVLVPSARPLLMVGVNQVIMMALNMVIISSMIGAGGLGLDVLLALRALKVGAAIEAGISIVLLAIVLDRLSQALALRTSRAAGSVLFQGGRGWRHPLLLLTLAILLVTTALSPFIPFLAGLPKSLTVTTAPFWDTGIRWITVHFFDAIEAGRVWFLLHVLKPVKLFLLALPWLSCLLLLGLAGLRLGGARLGLLIALLTAACAVFGLWDKVMTTLYLCAVSTVIACAIGVPIGMLAARSAIANRIITVAVDTLQTIPAFVYLIPAVMLFRVGDVAAMIGIVLYALTPAIRYTDHGLRQVPPALIEAATMSGCTPRQLLWKVQFPLALPELLLGINQVIMLALSMDIIAAMIGTRDLGQEVFSALATANVGRGLLAGLTVAFIGIIADRLMGAWSRNLRARFGLT
jgi:glycine betaine/proline transport system permease protein